MRSERFIAAGRQKQPAPGSGYARLAGVRLIGWRL